MAPKAPALQPGVRPISVFVAHSDCTSASRALAALAAQWKRRGQQVTLRPMLWRFRQLAEPRWSEVAMHDALRAECILLAMDREEAFDAQLESWVDALRGRAGGATLSLTLAIRGAEMWALTVVEQPKPTATVVAAVSAVEVLGSVATRRPAVAAA